MYEKMSNPFKSGTRSFNVIEMLNAGKTYDEVAKTMEYRNKNAISSTVSRGKQKNLLHEKKKLKPKGETSTPKIEGDEKLVDEAPELSEFEAFKQEILQIVGLRVGIPGQSEAETEKIEVDEGSLVKRILYLTPKTLLYFDTAKAAGYPGELSAYINDMINTVYKKQGVAIGLTQRRLL